MEIPPKPERPKCVEYEYYRPYQPLVIGLLIGFAGHVIMRLIVKLTGG